MRNRIPLILRQPWFPLAGLHLSAWENQVVGKYRDHQFIMIINFFDMVIKMILSKLSKSRLNDLQVAIGEWFQDTGAWTNETDWLFPTSKQGLNSFKFKWSNRDWITIYRLWLCNDLQGRRYTKTRPKFQHSPRSRGSNGGNFSEVRRYSTLEWAVI